MGQVSRGEALDNATQQTSRSSYNPPMLTHNAPPQKRRSPSDPSVVSLMVALSHARTLYYVLRGRSRHGREYIGIYYIDTGRRPVSITWPIARRFGFEYDEKWDAAVLPVGFDVVEKVNGWLFEGQTGIGAEWI